MTSFKKILSPLFLATLTACGGGGSGTGGLSGGTGTPISAQDFIDSINTGVIRVDNNVDLSGQVFPGAGDTTVTATGSVTASQVLSLIVNGSSVTTDSCTLEAPEFEENFTEDSLNDEETLASCTQEYFQINDSQFRIINVCDDIPDFTADFTYISDTPQFDLGTLSLNFGDASTDVAATDGVCGSLLANDTTILVDGTPTSSFNEFDIEIVAPYENENKIRLKLTFSNSALTTGDYTVVPPFTSTTTNEVAFELSSVEFDGGTLDFPARIEGASGQVSITSVGERAYEGTYNVQLENGVDVTGAFSLGL